MRTRLWHLALVAVLLSSIACGYSGLTSVITGPTATPTGTQASAACPAGANVSPSCVTPHALRAAYGIQSLLDKGFTGKGQTVVFIESYGSPTLQQDLDVFDRQFGLPATTVQVLSPLGTVPFDPTKCEMTGWAEETTLDVETVHALAPGAGLVVLTSPVDETEGLQGLPQFMQLEQYAVQHKLGYIFSQSWSASEATLTGSAEQQFIQNYAAFYQQITTQQGYTVVDATGDSGATDCAVVNCLDSQCVPSVLAPSRTVAFPADVPWVTAVGGTSLQQQGSSFTEAAWSGSNGGASKFFAEPGYQQGLPQDVQTSLGGQRGLPDVAADADPNTAWPIYVDGQWGQIGGTSASTPLWAALFAIADQMAGHPLGFVDPGLYKLGTSSSAGQDFRDVTSGNNDVNQDGVQVQGFNAVPGWDQVTGWGAPQADHLLPDLIAALKG